MVSRATRGYVYLLHFSHRLGGPGRNGARHYVGWAQANGLVDRLEEHWSGRSDVAIIRELHRRGWRFEVGAVWYDQTRQDERRRKKNGHHERECFWCVMEGK